MNAQRHALGLTAALLAVLALASATASAATPHASISVLSSRANLVSGHSALVRIDFSRARDVKGAKVTVGKRSVRKAFARSGSRSLVGVVRGLHTGGNNLTVRLPGGGGSRITLTDHPIGGPVSSGPQLEPWTC